MVTITVQPLAHPDGPKLLWSVNVGSIGGVTILPVVIKTRRERRVARRKLNEMARGIAQRTGDAALAATIATACRHRLQREYPMDQDEWIRSEQREPLPGGMRARR